MSKCSVIVFFLPCSSVAVFLLLFCSNKIKAKEEQNKSKTKAKQIAGSYRILDLDIQALLGRIFNYREQLSLGFRVLFLDSGKFN